MDKVPLQSQRFPHLAKAEFPLRTPVRKALR